MTAKISIVIPVYNIARYLRAAFGSAVNYIPKDIEILCADDGSMKDFLENDQKHAWKDSRIRTISKQNHAPFHARTTGAKAASGDFILSLDPDGQLEFGIAEKSYAIPIEENVDLIVV
jgi:glycosyltransferase involved in cell wall biosynthesis